MGPLLLRIEGASKNIKIGDNVTFMPWVDLKIRENGSIVLGDGVQLDTLTRIVAANTATVELGQDVKIGPHNIINAGTNVQIERGTISAGFVYINASDHKIERGKRLSAQGYWHAPVLIGSDSWIGAFTTITPGTIIGSHSVIASHSRVRGELPNNIVAGGNPAEVIRER